ncbi:GNAT family N-acetyltransferase [Xanthomonas sp. CFBP 8445]|uniref:GNAT family N-acetyltransferase n=1 Tax=Xanthomonas sp. CFBP 8445 TaxID=2971236 RepID=UPI0021E0B081|nr:GNAT family N-acetyltransferase [Xanthomonas sp. CFBP 8445]UYC14071.1 GNAT family N-acetyltransferase [Xanthomonas sp. CFBP 8445]
MLSVRPYTAADAPTWDAVVAASRNGNLLHRRGYMDYHATRFVDASLLVEHAGTPVAVFPANREGDAVASHAGLSYAGLLSTHALRATATLEALERIAAHYRDAGVRTLLYKAVPHLFHRSPAEEDLYALHRLGARLQRRDLSSAVPLRQPPRMAAARKRSVAKARRAGLRVQRVDDPAPLHALLGEVLQRHDARPTHSLEELRLLCARFPAQIVPYEVRDGAELLAGTLVYDFGHVVHTQYLACSEQGRRADALSLLLAELIEQVYAQRDVLSLGISTEQQGQVLNAGLVEQKERFGARAVVHDFYRWELQ